MLTVRSWDDLDKIMKTHTPLQEVSAIMILILNPNNNSEVQKQVLNNIEYLHLRSGHHVDFYLPGFVNPKSYNAKDMDKYFDSTLFVDFIEDFEAKSIWKYSGGSQLVVIKYMRDTFSFSGIYDINLDRLRMYCPQQIIDGFFEELIRVFDKPGINMDNLFVDTAKKFVLRSQGWDLVSSFFAHEVKTIFSGLYHSAQIFKLFKKKDVRLRIRSNHLSKRK